MNPSSLLEMYSLLDTLSTQPLFSHDTQFSLSHILIPPKALKHSLNHANNSLSLYYLVLSILEDALVDFTRHKFRNFDALIGNNSCYVVSYIVFLIAHDPLLKKTKVRSAIRAIQKIKRKINALTKHFQALPSSTSLSHFIQEHSLDISLSIKHLYLAMAFACTIAKHKNSVECEEINYNALISEYSNKLVVNFQKKSVQKMIKYWQKLLSVLNVCILQEKTKQHSPELPWSNYILNNQYILQDHRERLCAPSLYSAAVIYNQLLKMPGALLSLQVNLITPPKEHLNRFTLFYEVQPDETLKIVDPEHVPIEQPTYVFVGCRSVTDYHAQTLQQIRDEFEQQDLKQLIMAHEVTYPQYPKSLQASEIVPVEPELKKVIRSLKKLKGFSLEDSSKLCLVHIFVDDILTQSLASYEPPVYLPLSPQEIQNTQNSVMATDDLKCSIRFTADLDTNKLVEMIMPFDKPNIVLWYCGIYGLKRKSVDFYAQQLLAPTLEGNSSAVFWLVDLSAWNAFRVPSANLTQYHPYCEQIERVGHQNIRCIRSSKVFQQMENISQEEIVRHFRHALQAPFIKAVSQAFPNRGIAIQDIFHHGCPILSDWYHADTAKAYSACQYLEACLLIEEICAQIQQKHAQDRIQIVFALPNDELKYYQDQQDSFRNDVSFLIKHSEKICKKPLEIEIHFLAFKYGTKIHHRPYNAPGRILDEDTFSYATCIGGLNAAK